MKISKTSKDSHKSSNFSTNQSIKALITSFAIPSEQIKHQQFRKVCSSQQMKPTKKLTLGITKLQPFIEKRQNLAKSNQKQIHETIGGSLKTQYTLNNNKSGNLTYPEIKIPKKKKKLIEKRETYLHNHP